MNAVTIRQDAPTPSDDLTTTWSRYTQALADLRAHRTAKADHASRILQEALEQGRQLRETSRTLRASKMPARETVEQAPDVI